MINLLKITSKKMRIYEISILPVDKAERFVSPCAEESFEVADKQWSLLLVTDKLSCALRKLSVVGSDR